MKSKFSRIAIFRDEFCSKVSSWGKKRERRERERGREREKESERERERDVYIQF